MITSRELAAALYGAWRLARFDPRGQDQFDTSVAGFWCSFQAAGIVVPAYVFLIIESMIDAGVYLGMTREMARTLSLQTVVGSARLVQESGRSPAELREMVSSPGGTTVEALKVLEEGEFRATIINAIVAAYEKSKRLGE